MQKQFKPTRESLSWQWPSTKPVCERQQDKEEPKNYYTLKLCVMVKKSDHEIKTILKYAMILLKMNMRATFQKAELLDWQILMHFNGVPLKTLHRAWCLLGPVVNLLNISFKSKTATEILLETKLRKKYTFPQQHESNALF